MVPTYTNPVHDAYFADPFVLQVEDRYLAYATELGADGKRAMPILSSADLVHWEPLGHALERLTLPTARDYWAPEVAASDGRFYLYYSAGIGDRHHQLRVASADAPEGPFVDHGRILTGDDPFTIDAHPFRDVDGQWYFFYARDVLDAPRVGTAVFVDRMVDMETLEGNPRLAVGATADWQLFARNRPMYGAVHDWHTIEGPFVVRRGGRYVCFYSGGSWLGETYGVSYGVADSPMGPYAEASGDGPLLLRTVPGHAIGPGHCSIVVGPDGADYVAYHAWDPERRARRMMLDRVEWDGAVPRCTGPTWTPQPIPR